LQRNFAVYITCTQTMGYQSTSFCNSLNNSFTFYLFLFRLQGRP